MNPFQAVLLGVLQGLTEFLPVSSSGHLVLAQAAIPGFFQPGVLFDAALHAGTTLAVVWYFRKKILSLDGRRLALLALATIPVAIAGLAFSSSIEALFSSPRAVGVALLLTGAMNWMVDRNWKTERALNAQNRKQKTDAKKALVVGIFQAVALVPGISRSGSTIFAGVAQNVGREEAATFSFLLSIPAVAGAVFLQLAKHGLGNQSSYFAYFLGMAAAAMVGYLSINVLMRLLLSRRFRIFAYYCFLVGLTTLILAS